MCARDQDIRHLLYVLFVGWNLSCSILWSLAKTCKAVFGTPANNSVVVAPHKLCWWKTVVDSEVFVAVIWVVIDCNYCVLGNLLHKFSVAVCHSESCVALEVQISFILVGPTVLPFFGSWKEHLLCSFFLCPVQHQPGGQFEGFLRKKATEKNIITSWKRSWALAIRMWSYTIRKHTKT